MVTATTLVSSSLFPRLRLNLAFSQDDAFGPFSDSNAATSHNFASGVSSGFSFPEGGSGSFTFSDDDGFGDFQAGNIQIGVDEEGESTPRKWSFASDFGAQVDDEDMELPTRMERISLNDNERSDDQGSSLGLQNLSSKPRST